MTSRFHQAYDAFHRDLPQLFDQGHRGRWVLYHGAERIALDDDRDQLYQVAQERQIPEDELLIDLIAAEPEEIDTDSMLFR
jgi:hypothetical protein